MRLTGAPTSWIVRRSSGLFFLTSAVNRAAIVGAGILLLGGAAGPHDFARAGLAARCRLGRVADRRHAVGGAAAGPSRRPRLARGSRRGHPRRRADRAVSELAADRGAGLPRLRHRRAVGHVLRRRCGPAGGRADCRLHDRLPRQRASRPRRCRGSRRGTRRRPAAVRRRARTCRRGGARLSRHRTLGAGHRRPARLPRPAPATRRAAWDVSSDGAPSRPPSSTRSPHPPWNGSPPSGMPPPRRPWTRSRA
jgi:hypothetical protein